MEVSSTAPATPQPAAATSASICPCSAIRPATPACTEASSSTSMTRPAQPVLPVPRRLAPATVQPAAASRPAQARPSPADAPVTSATRAVSVMPVSFSRCQWRWLGSGVMTVLAGVLDGLNADQLAAATHQGSPLLILAGAGTGKTGTLVARAAWLREQGIQPSRILLLTFTRRAADDMLARAQPPGMRAADRIFGGTFHAVAHRIIRSHAESFALPPEVSVIDTTDSADIMETLRD